MIFAWLIERNIPDGKPRWWTRDKRWTEDAWEAARFPNRAVCEQRIRLEGLLYAKAVEHGFDERADDFNSSPTAHQQGRGE